MRLAALCPQAPFASFDIGYRTYVAVCRMDHRYNNPVCVVFFNQMMRMVAVKRRARARRLLRRSFALVWHVHVALRGIAERGKNGKRSIDIDHSTLRYELVRYIKHHDAAVEKAVAKAETPKQRATILAKEAPYSLLANQDAKLDRARLARNRWQLALFMLKNPVLQGYRWHALLYMQKKRDAAEAKVGKCAVCKKVPLLARSPSPSP